MKHYVKLDIDQKPVSLLRVDDNDDVQVWYQGDWQQTRLLAAELQGLGGSSDYWSINAGDVAKWKRELD